MLKFLWIDWFCILELWLGQHYQPYNVVDLAICVQCTHDTADRLERGTRQARWTAASCSRAGNSWTAWWEVEIKQLNFFGIWKYFAAVLINKTMQVLKIYLFLAALGIPFQPLPDYEEGADQVLFFYVHFGWKVLVSNIWRIFTCRYWDTNPQCFFLYLSYISGFVDCETLHGKVKCSLCFPCKKTDICSIQIKEGSRTRGVCLFILAVFLKNYVQI